MLLSFFLLSTFVGIEISLNKFYFMFLVIIFFHLFFYQLRKLKINDTIISLKVSKLNNFLGFLIFMGLLILKNIL